MERRKCFCRGLFRANIGFYRTSDIRLWQSKNGGHIDHCLHARHAASHPNGWSPPQCARHQRHQTRNCHIGWFARRGLCWQQQLSIIFIDTHLESRLHRRCEYAIQRPQFGRFHRQCWPIQSTSRTAYRATCAAFGRCLGILGTAFGVPLLRRRTPPQTPRKRNSRRIRN